MGRTQTTRKHETPSTEAPAGKMEADEDFEEWSKTYDENKKKDKKDKKDAKDEK